MDSIIQILDNLADKTSPAPSAKERLSELSIEIGTYIDSIDDSPSSPPASDGSSGNSIADNLPHTPSEQAVVGSGII
jgi:hypothetical protein